MNPGKMMGLIALAALAALAACAAPSGQSTDSQQASAARGAIPEKKQPSRPTQAKTETAALKGLLSLLASADGEQWGRYDAVAGVAWFDAAPAEYADGKHARSGQLLLAGFGTVKLPNGKTGAEYQLVDGNEGQSGITLDGDAGRVRMLSVKKHYFSEGYSKILMRQLGGDGSVTGIANHCTSEDETENPRGSSFFKVDFAGGKTIYVEAFLEAGGKYSPGYTVFDFHRSRPTEKIMSLHCREA